MKKHRKGLSTLSLFATVVVVAGTCLVTGGFLYVVNGKTDWQDAPVYPGGKNVQTAVSGDGLVKTTTFSVSEFYPRLPPGYLARLNAQNWNETSVQNSPAQDVTLSFVDGSKNIEIPGLGVVYQNTCPAFYLDVSIEYVTRFDTRITLVQSVGPCGRPTR